MGNTTPKNDQQRRSTGTGVIGFIVRFVVAAIVLMVTAYFVPGFKMRGGFSTALIAALVIAAADFLIEKLFKFDASPLGRGISGFLVSAAVIYFTQYLVQGMEVSLLGAVIGALVIGLVDTVLPTRFM
ncbi:MAG TPA: phage holin family protein [Bacillota bacterium]|jgi:putative membrane protein|nr:phage holin family protein [Bacillota bacterium]HRU41740.1 phage holin family protein [Candidatus Diapherotrites archaeon]HQE66015.1 phage holin family protein [Bacillota bacterium]HQI16306.1 phage holin family protein [Bacillota bacterium]HQJ38014.1 phage holin family protein [Bacillota bacterium]